jgi:CheY-like chemotaxis protein
MKKEKTLNSILLIEDDLEILMLNEKYLISKGYSVFTADCGEAALKVLQKTVPDCIVLDVMLPDIIGFDLCEKIRQICNVPIIYLSCKDTENDKVQGLISGGDDYMTKPFSMRELEARISAQLRRIAIIQEQETEVLKKINDQYDALRIMKHDYKHHLNTALGMIRRGEHKKGDEYLAGLQTEFSKYDLVNYCKNPVTNSLIAYYVGRCKETDIEFDVSISIPDDFSFPNYEMCIVLGNLLENAVEACQKIKAGGQNRLDEQGRRIELVIKP